MRTFRPFGSEGIYDDGTLRAAVYFELLRRRGVSLVPGDLLDVGSGFGGFPLHAARAGARVTAIDGDEYRLSILRKRLLTESRAVRERVTMLKADAPHLPVRDACFDHALSIGVVEWVPVVSSDPDDPRAVQVRTFAEIRRVLRPGGMYVLATKNRWYPLHMWREPQTRWLVVDALPRPLAQRLARAVFGQSYRAYNHSVRGWRDMLCEAGFSTVRLLTPVWGMHWPVDLVPGETSPATIAGLSLAAEMWLPEDYLRKTRGRRAGVKRLATTAAWSARLGQVLAQGFVFVATA